MVDPPFQTAVAYGPYQSKMRLAIHALKYDGMEPAARQLGEMLAVAIAKLASEAPAEMLVVPVPLHRTKYRQRGFNQARKLAEQALERLAVTHPGWKLELAPDALLRQRPTTNQAGLTWRQRRLNVRGAFEVTSKDSIRARHILLIDDIYTTGATVKAATQVMLRAGAASVRVATLAHTGKRKGNPLFKHEPTPAQAPAAQELLATGPATSSTQGNSLHDQPSF